MQEGGIRGFLGAANPALLRIWVQFASVWHSLERIIRAMIPAFKTILPIFIRLGLGLFMLVGILLHIVSILPGLKYLFYILAFAVGIWAIKLELAVFWTSALIIRDIALWIWGQLLTGMFIKKAVAIEADTAATETNTAATVEQELVYTRFGKYLRFGLLADLGKVRRAMKVLWTGEVVGPGNTFRKWTTLDRMAMKFRSSLLLVTQAIGRMAIAFFTALGEMTVALLTTPVGWLILLIAAITVGLVVLYFKWKRFHNLVNETWIWMREHWWLLATTVLGPFLIGSEIYSHWEGIKRYFIGWFNWLNGKIQWISKQIHRFLGWAGFIGHQASTNVQHIAHPTGGAPSQNDLRMRTHVMWPGGPAYPGQASGGITTSPGMSLVGEHGPEMLYLPTAATVVPLGTQTSLNAGGWAGPKDLYATTILQVDGLQLAKVVTKHQANAEARR
jgi:hypothetical protein